MDDLNNNEPLSGIAMVARSSVYSLRAASVVSDTTSSRSEDFIWKLNELRARFKNKDLEKLYLRYQQRLMHVDLKAYLLLQMVISVLLIVALLSLNTDDVMRALPEIIGHFVLFSVATIFYSFAYKGRPFQKHKHLHILMALALTFLLVAVDLGLDVWFSIRNRSNQTEEIIFHIPATFYTILVVYNLLPIVSLRATILVGCSVSSIHLLATAFLFQPIANHGRDTAMIAADGVFYLTANLVGIFTKCLNEMTLRKAFLDRRQCIEGTIKLDYEKNQEQQLMLSILPTHIAEKVGDALRAEIVQNTKPTSKKPFTELHVESHPEVSVLFADIVNFTPLTASLSASNLVSMLNELFGQFDEVAKENNCSRIKILGDCYYCVSGIPDPTTPHAKNCVEMGFKMIEIIRQVRIDHQVDVDMRIGIHSGRVISGILGIRKWQFDIWSRDVTIANHMEQSGKPGRIHISMATKNLLGDAYQYEPCKGKLRDTYLVNLGIETFLVVQDGVDPEKKTLDSDNKRIQFQEASSVPLLTIPRSNSLVIETVSSEIQQVNFKTMSKPVKDFDDTLNENLYEKIPASLPVTDPRRSRPTTSLPHIFTKGRRVTNGEEQTEEIYQRARNRRKSSATSATERRILALQRRSTTGEHTNRRGALLMNSTLCSFRQMLKQADSEMDNTIETMPLSKFKSSVGDSNRRIKFTLMFSDWSWELPFMRRPDPLFSFYVFGAFLVLMGIMTIQLVLYQTDPRSFWYAFYSALVVVILAAAFLWIPQLGLYLRSRTSNASNVSDERPSLASPTSSRSSNHFLRSSYLKSNSIFTSLAARILIFLIVTIAVEACGLIDLDRVVNDYTQTTNGTIEGHCQFKDPRLYLWYYTYSCALTMTVAFSFYRIHFVLKCLFYLAAMVTYSVLIFNDVYEDICTLMGFNSNDKCYLCTASPSFQPESNHIVYLSTIFLVLHIADRQIEFIYRLDYVWHRKLVEEQQEAKTRRVVNQVLLMNILPQHVAEVYLNTSRSSDNLRSIYHEEHSNVAVMFASIPEFMDYYTENDAGDGGLRCLEVLNSIISAFDTLTYEKDFALVEKIKLVGSTYMAASGLTSSHRGSSEAIDNNESSLITMVKFASAMGKALERQNQKQSLNFRLRIGIDYGPVIAGVVGAQKPLYDIWGNTVNMASRLESTGQLDELQITESTAKLLEAEGIYCKKRGETFLKGKGSVMTFWVRPDWTEYNNQTRTSMTSRSIVSLYQSTFSLSEMFLLDSVRNSVRRPSNRASTLFEEDEDANSAIMDDSLNQLPIVSLTSEPERKSSVVIPMSEEVETTTSTDENLNKYIIDGLMVDQDLEVTPM